MLYFGWARLGRTHKNKTKRISKNKVRILDIMAGESYLLQGTIYSKGQTMTSYYNRTEIGQGGQRGQCKGKLRNNVPEHNETRVHDFWAKADHGNLGPLLRGSEQKQAEVDGRCWKCQKICGSEWETVEGKKDGGRGQKM